MIIKISHLTKKFKKQFVFENANLIVDKPDIYGLVAPNGFGKTTLLNIISGLTSFQSGEVILFDQKTTMPPRELSYLQNNEVLYKFLTGRDHLKFICDIHSIASKKIEEIANTYEMTGYLDKKVGNYSLGMKQRLLLAMALIKEPKLLLLDEPLTGLDPTSTIIVREALLQAKREGMTILISSHDLNELDKLTNRIFFIKDHQITLETIAMLDKSNIEIVVSTESIEAFERLVESENISFEIQEEKYVLNLGTLDSWGFIKVLVQKNIRIRSFEQSAVRSEQLYKEKYENKESSL